MGFAVGIDVGGTTTKLAVLDEAGVIAAEARLPTECSAGPLHLVQRSVAAARELCDRAAVQLEDAVAVGVGMAGLVDRSSGTLVAAPNLPTWQGLEIAATFGPAFGLPVEFDNDAAAFALAESVLGAGRGRSLLVGLTLGTGVGGGIVVEGNLLRGVHGVAGEFGHMPYIADGLPCACGARGCFEPYVNAAAVVRAAVARASEAPHRVPSSWIQRIAADRLEAREVGQAAAAGHPEAVAVLRDVGRELGRGIAILVNALNPDCVVVGGGVAEAGSALIDAAREAACSQLLPALQQDLTIEGAALGDRGGVLGAALLALGASGRAFVANGERG